MYKFPIIVFEGIETSGKTTSIKQLSKYLAKNKIKFVKIREPGGSKYSEVIRKLILNKKSKLNTKTDMLLILASRSENFEKVIKKYQNKKVILIDRFTDSTIAYQHYGMDINLNLIKKLNKFIIGNLKPSLTFLNIVNKNNMRKRMNLRKYKNKYDNFNFAFYNKVQKGFLKIANNNKKYVILNSDIMSISENKSFIIKNFNRLIRKHENKK